MYLTKDLTGVRTAVSLLNSGILPHGCNPCSQPCPVRYAAYRRGSICVFILKTEMYSRVLPRESSTELMPSPHSFYVGRQIHAAPSATLLTVLLPCKGQNRCLDNKHHTTMNVRIDDFACMRHLFATSTGKSEAPRWIATNSLHPLHRQCSDGSTKVPVPQHAGGRLQSVVSEAPRGINSTKYPPQ